MSIFILLKRNVMYEIKTAIGLVIVGIFSYLGIKEDVFFALAAMIVIDTFLGYIGAVLYKDQTGGFSSNKAFVGITKKFVVLFLPVALAFFGHVAGGVVITDITTGLFTALALAELYSIVGNAYFILSGTKITEHDAMVDVIKWLYGQVEKRLSNIFKENDTNGKN